MLLLNQFRVLNISKNIFKLLKIMFFDIKARIIYNYLENDQVIIQVTIDKSLTSIYWYI